MKRTARDWHVQHQKDDGFTLRLEETSLWGEVAGVVFYRLTDHEWFGKYKNFPFCWINPWNWTHHLGTEDHNVGYWWWKAGQRVCGLVDDLSKPIEKHVVPLTVEQVKRDFPDTWKRLGFLADPSMPSPWDDEDEESE